MKLVSQRYEECVPLERLRTHPDNPRKGNLESIEESVDFNGFYGAVVVQEHTGYIIAGNHRYLAAQSKGAESLPVIWLDVDDTAALRIMLADNRTSDDAGYDEFTLAKLLNDIPDLSGTGWTDKELDQLLKGLNVSPTLPSDGGPGIETTTCPKCGHEFVAGAGAP